jgi:hypothetical protein
MASRMSSGEEFPTHVRDLPLDTKVAVLYERVQNLDEDVKSLRRTLWAFISALIAGAVLFLFSIASGWIGNAHTTLPAGQIAKGVYHWMLG